MWRNGEATRDCHMKLLQGSTSADESRFSAECSRSHVHSADEIRELTHSRDNERILAPNISYAGRRVPKPRYASAGRIDKTLSIGSE